MSETNSAAGDRGERLDVLLVKRGLQPSRERARQAIEAGLVSVAGQVTTKPAFRCDAACELVVTGSVHPYVSRGGLKLAQALDGFALAPAGAIALDIGASTGGFTDCLLQRGAARVYAVDVGTDQLAPALRADPRVISLEQTNARYLTGEQIPEPINLVTIDVSFISLDRLWAAILPLMAPAAAVVALVKPQFEAGPTAVGRNGVVRSPAVHARVIIAAAQAAQAAGLAVAGLTYSPVRGPEGNIEFLLFLRADTAPMTTAALTGLAGSVVARAHTALA